MSKLAKKCFIASTGVHLLLLVVLIFGSAFFVSRQKTETGPAPLTFIPEKTVDALVNPSGGNPNVEPAPTPPPPPPAPEKVEPPPPPSAPEVKRAEPVVVKPVEIEPPPAKIERPNSFKLPPPSKKKLKTMEAKVETPKETKPKTPPKKTEIKVDLTPVTREKRDELREAVRRQQEEAEAQRRAQERAYAKYAAQRSKQLDSALANLNKGLTPSMAIEMPGPGGEAFANYGQVVISIYENAWLVPPDLSSDAPTVKATVTIRKDGSVISARVIGASGNSKVDHSVEKVLRDVKFIAPFPEGAKESQRTFNIDFNLKMKRQIG